MSFLAQLPLGTPIRFRCIIDQCEHDGVITEPVNDWAVFAALSDGTLRLVLPGDYVCRYEVH